MDSFLVFFYILEQCYILCHEDDLGGFLGAISPEIWEDGKPIDIAVYNDWQNQNAPMETEIESVPKQIYEFLDRYETNFGYDFSKTKKILTSSITKDMLQEAKKKAAIQKIRFNVNPV